MPAPSSPTISTSTSTPGVDHSTPPSSIGSPTMGPTNSFKADKPPKKTATITPQKSLLAVAFLILAVVLECIDHDYTLLKFIGLSTIILSLSCIIGLFRESELQWHEDDVSATTVECATLWAEDVLQALYNINVPTEQIPIPSPVTNTAKHATLKVCYSLIDNTNDTSELSMLAPSFVDLAKPFLDAFSIGADIFAPSFYDVARLWTEGFSSADDLFVDDSTTAVLTAHLLSFERANTAHLFDPSFIDLAQPWLDDFAAVADIFTTPSTQEVLATELRRFDSADGLLANTNTCPFKNSLGAWKNFPQAHRDPRRQYSTPDTNYSPPVMDPPHPQSDAAKPDYNNDVYFLEWLKYQSTKVTLIEKQHPYLYITNLPGVWVFRIPAAKPESSITGLDHLVIQWCQAAQHFWCPDYGLKFSFEDGLDKKTAGKPIFSESPNPPDGAAKGPMMWDPRRNDPAGPWWEETYNGLFPAQKEDEAKARAQQEEAYYQAQAQQEAEAYYLARAQQEEAEAMARAQEEAYYQARAQQEEAYYLARAQQEEEAYYQARAQQEEAEAIARAQQEEVYFLTEVWKYYVEEWNRAKEQYVQHREQVQRAAMEAERAAARQQQQQAEAMGQHARMLEMLENYKKEHGAVQAEEAWGSLLREALGEEFTADFFARELG